MKKTSLAFILALAGLSMASAYAQDVLGDRYFSVNTPAPLTHADEQALNIAQQHNKTLGRPLSGEWGSVEFAYGRGQPTIVSAPLHVTDIALQKGEIINSLQIGDAVRWTLEPMVSGNKGDEQVHIIVKPKDVGLETNLVVATNKRVYNLRLKSTRTDYLPTVTFSYPEVQMEKFRQAQQARAEFIKKDTIPETGERISQLDFEYEVDGSASWKPARVYNDGVKTYVDLPPTVSAKDLPTLLMLREEGGIFSEDNVEIINYRYQEGRFIVDGVPDKLVLISGVGSDQQRVMLSRKTK